MAQLGFSLDYKKKHLIRGKVFVEMLLERKQGAKCKSLWVAINYQGYPLGKNLLKEMDNDIIKK